MDRRKFLSGATLLTLSSLSAEASSIAAKAASLSIESGRNVTSLQGKKLNNVRFGFIGVGERGGKTLLRLTLQLPDAKVVALCDIDAKNLALNRKQVVEATGEEPALYTGSEDAYKAMLERDDIDAVIIATPWRYHTPMAVDVMISGKHALVEVPAALNADECWQLVETSEKTQKHCMMLENVCYGREEMMVMNMVQQNLFGELLHGEAAYIHELRWQMKEVERKTGSWRTDWHTKVNGNIYPTHGLGPIAQFMNINRGDRFDYLVSMSSPSVGRAEYAQENFPATHKRNKAKYIAGDMNSTLIKTKNGRSILLQHDTTTPRPYTRLNLIQGTNGTFAGFPNRIALENNPLDPQQKNGFHNWDYNIEKWFENYDHPLWKSIQQQAQAAGGHGGMDYMMMWRVVDCLKNGYALDQNVYDAAAWSVIVELSSHSVAKRSASIDIPDFTRGAWKTNPKLEINI